MARTSFVFPPELKKYKELRSAAAKKVQSRKRIVTPSLGYLRHLKREVEGGGEVEGETDS